MEDLTKSSMDDDMIVLTKNKLAEVRGTEIAIVRIDCRPNLSAQLSRAVKLTNQQ